MQAPRCSFSTAAYYLTVDREDNTIVPAKNTPHTTASDMQAPRCTFSTISMAHHLTVDGEDDLPWFTVSWEIIEHPTLHTAREQQALAVSNSCTHVPTMHFGLHCPFHGKCFCLITTGADALKHWNQALSCCCYLHTCRNENSHALHARAIPTKNLHT